MLPLPYSIYLFINWPFYPHKLPSAPNRIFLLFLTLDPKDTRLEMIKPIQHIVDVVIMNGIPDSTTKTPVTEAKVLPPDETAKLVHPRSCYTCKLMFRELHFFYAQFCPSCAAFNYTKRTATANLVGRVAIVTGGRVKIGFQIALRLLRCGSRVIVTSRFPVDTAKRFSQQPDYAVWQSNLFCVGLDMRHLGHVEQFCAFVVANFPRLDVLINNACQTVRRPASFYSHLIGIEKLLLTDLPENIRLQLPQHFNPTNDISLTDSNDNRGISTSKVVVGVNGNGINSATLSQLHVHCDDFKYTAGDSDLPSGAFDVNGQQIDLRTRHSWNLKMAEVSTPEVAEVFIINALAPFVLNGKLKELLAATPGDKFIVNVSAMEGKFYRIKTSNHPHTNMAKAALNMMTRTSAQDYQESRIYMTSVDTGWVNDENPLETASRIAKVLYIFHYYAFFSIIFHVT